jgi:hypothetical protein
MDEAFFKLLKKTYGRRWSLSFERFDEEYTETVAKTKHENHELYTVVLGPLDKKWVSLEHRSNGIIVSFFSETGMQDNRYTFNTSIMDSKNNTTYLGKEKFF